MEAIRTNVMMIMMMMTLMIIIIIIIVVVVVFTNADLVEVLLKLRRIIIDVINIDGDVSTCCVPTVRYL